MEKTQRIRRRKYGSKYQDHLLEQYKTYVEMAEAASQRKEQVNRYYRLSS